MSDNTSGFSMIAEPTEDLTVRGRGETPTPEEERLAKRLVNRWYTMALHDGFPPMWQRVAAALAQHRIRTQAAGKEKVQ